MTSTELRSSHEECGDTKNRKYMRQVRGGYIWYCHNCACKGFISNGITPPSETVKNIISTTVGVDSTTNVVKEIRLPADYSISTIPIYCSQQVIESL